jgi:hypothetical protein
MESVVQCPKPLTNKLRGRNTRLTKQKLGTELTGNKFTGKSISYKNGYTKLLDVATPEQFAPYRKRSLILGQLRFWQSKKSLKTIVAKTRRE